MKKSSWFAGLLVVSNIIMTGCTSYDPILLHQQQLNNSYTFYKLEPPLYKGDVVQYKLKDGSNDAITIQRTTPQGLVTNTGQFIPYKDIVSLERKDISKGKTAAAVGAGAGATAVVLVAIFAITLGAGFAAILTGS